MTYTAWVNVVDDVAFSSALARYAERATVERTPLALITLSLDHLARIEGRHGKVASELLRQLGDLTRDALEGPHAPIIARLGNARVGVLLDVDIDGARAAADTVRRIVAKTPFDIEGSAVAMTTSVGVAMFVVKYGAAALVRASCAAMQDAAQHGGNRVASGS